MKRFCLLCLFLLFLLSGSLSAQNIPQPQNSAPVANEAVQKGNWLVGASLGSIGQNFRSKTFTLDINPRLGYFISNNVAVGTEFQLGLQLYKGGEYFNYGFTPFIRYYFPEGQQLPAAGLAKQ